MIRNLLLFVIAMLAMSAVHASMIPTTATGVAVLNVDSPAATLVDTFNNNTPAIAALGVASPVAPDAVVDNLSESLHARAVDEEAQTVGTTLSTGVVSAECVNAAHGETPTPRPADAQTRRLSAVDALGVGGDRRVVATVAMRTRTPGLLARPPADTAT